MKRIRWRYYGDGTARFVAQVGDIKVFATSMVGHHARWWDVCDATRSVVVRHKNRNAAARAVAAAEEMLP